MMNHETIETPHGVNCLNRIRPLRQTTESLCILLNEGVNFGELLILLLLTLAVLFLLYGVLAV